jgi:hypothetical protein
LNRLLLVVLLAVPAVAAPRDFPLTWSSHTSEAGEDSLEAWITPRIARTDDFVQLDTRLAWTKGVARTLESQLSLDLDFQRTDLTQGVDPKVSSLWRWTTWRANSPFAVAGIGRVSLGLDQFEVEGRLVADLTIQRALIALNISGSRALFWNDRTGVDTRLEESLGVKFALSSTAAFGVEVRVKSSWEKRAYKGTAVYTGPVLTWTHPAFWISFGAYAQVAAEKAPEDKALAEPQELRDNERFVLRFSFGLVTPK